MFARSPVALSLRDFESIPMWRNVTQDAERLHAHSNQDMRVLGSEICLPVSNWQDEDCANGFYTRGWMLTPFGVVKQVVLCHTFALSIVGFHLSLDEEGELDPVELPFIATSEGRASDSSLKAIEEKFGVQEERLYPLMAASELGIQCGNNVWGIMKAPPDCRLGS